MNYSCEVGAIEVDKAQWNVSILGTISFVCIVQEGDLGDVFEPKVSEYPNYTYSSPFASLIDPISFNNTL